MYLPFMDFITNEISSTFPKSELQRVGQIQKLLSPEFSDGFEDEVAQGAKPCKDDLPCFSALKGELRSSVSTLMCPTGYNEHSRELIFDIACPENLSTEHNDQKSAKCAGFAAYPPGYSIRNET
ncbi:hypothetical protein PR048_012090 [Dryococelus australis]|uniref:Uncharacterized protein n=1 Tax=Dryococelus australis TaxID=614101 RepID=A0ABQ9HNC6_9NEOP|nr:hypothetical protein PR048_012090 [Dryococelus australis]